VSTAAASPGERPRVVVITGSGGIGLACARQLGDRRKVLLAEAIPERLAEPIATLRAEGLDVDGVVCDITDAASVSALAAKTRAAGAFEALVHTAGLSRSMADERRIIEVNLLGTTLVLDAFLDLAEAGTVAVCIASVAAYRRGPERFDDLLSEPLDALDRLVEIAAGQTGRAYDLSKHGVVLQCERRARAWGERGARLVSLSPGPIDTPMGRLEGGGRGANMVKYSALGHVGTAEEVAEVVGFLCSPAARHVTGCDLRVDGGGIPGMRHEAPAELTASWNGWQELAD
jgi:NAD(P)-dependent dehydrogenase (short-subunit alcohol dehydrogenase family)